MKIQAPAKLNLYLHVKGKRADGYHELESQVVFLNLFDELEFTPAPTLELNSDIENNIILKAARALSAAKGAKITLTKKIPMGAGLGGGSVNAAATLFALNKLWDLNYSYKELYEIAAQLGADVPCCLYYFLEGKNSVTFKGKGEILEAADAPEYFYLLVNPNIHLATKDVFNAFEKSQSTMPFENDLEPAAIKLCPQIAGILQRLKGTNPIFARMTGSGSTCFATYESATKATAAAKLLPDNYFKFIASSALGAA